MKTKRISFDVDADIVDIIKKKATNEHRTLASYMRCVLYDIAYGDNSEDDIKEDFKIEEPEPEIKVVKDDLNVNFSNSKPKIKGGL